MFEKFDDWRPKVSPTIGRQLAMITSMPRGTDSRSRL
jgi:hypothetical protein